MTLAYSTTVLVVGAGPVGLFLALRLAQLSIPVIVVEAVDQLTHKPKAYAYQPFVFPEFDKAGVLADLRAESATTNDDGSLTFRTPADDAKSIFYRAEPPPGGSVSSLKLSQHAVGQILLRHIAKHDKAQVLMGHRLVRLREKSGAIEATTQTSHESGVSDSAAAEKTFTAQYLVGADGGRSTVRKLSNIAFKGETLPQHLVAADVRYPFEKHGAPGVNFLIDPTHYGVWGPIDNHGLWRVSLGLPVRGEDEPSWSEEEIRKAIPAKFDAMFPGPRPLEYEVVHVAGYRTHQLHAETFRKGRVMLVGDAAHLTNPFMAFGLVSGVYDGSSLAAALAAVISDTATESILDSWAEARKNVFTKIVDTSSRAAFKANRMDALNDPDSVIQVHPVIQRFETMKKNGGKFTPPPLGTDITALDGWTGAQKQQKEGCPELATTSGLGNLCNRILGGFQSALGKTPGLVS